MASLLAALKLRPLAIILVALALIVLLWKSDESRESVLAEKLRGPDEPDSFVVDGRFRSFNAEGKLQETIQSPRIEQFDDRDEAVMETPEARLIDQSSGAPWRVTAEKGHYKLDKEVMHLSGNVVVIRSGKKQNAGKKQSTSGDNATDPDDAAQSADQDIRLETEKLTLDNKKRIVHTDAPVVIHNPGGTTRGVGMRGWVDKGVVQLESQVRGTYEPKARR